MRLIYIIVLLFSFPALADDNEVPDPIPESFNECVRAIATDKGKENGFKGRVAEWEPPLSTEDRAFLEYYRREGWAKLQLCGKISES